MLTSLSIRDIVLIEKLDLFFEKGLTVLTGETGAGKSILMDSLGLATGARADRALVRQNQEQASVIAEFSLNPTHAACRLLDDTGIDSDDGNVILRRIIGSDGRSRAWVNDQPVSRRMLADLGALLIEVHGQHDDRGFLEAGAHRALLDAFGKHETELTATKAAYTALQYARDALAKAEADLVAVKADEDYILHAQGELSELNPLQGEEALLADQRALMMQSEKLLVELKAYQQEISGRNGMSSALRGVLRKMERAEGPAVVRLSPVIQAVDRASVELADGAEELDRLIAELQFEPHDVDAVEERLFEIRRLARKHNCQPDQLTDVFEQFVGRAKELSTGGETVQRAQRAVEAARQSMETAVIALRSKRMKSAARLDKMVCAELPPLKLEKAIFRSAIEFLDEQDWNQVGGERVSFEVKTNPNTAFGPMLKVASGGELARFILSLKVVLAEGGSAPVMVFDEVDRGIGGATASAVGDRLKRLSENAQVLVVTHSPQVAALGLNQYQISKGSEAHITRTHVRKLENNERREEIARMLAGAEITDAARAAADQLLAIGG